MSSGWYGVDLDGTLAKYDHWKGATHIGEPIPEMVQRVNAWLAEGKDVRIFTARCWPIGVDFNRTGLDLLTYRLRITEAQRATAAIQEWCKQQFGVILRVTCCKDYEMLELWDDRAVQVIRNTGVRADGQGKLEPTHFARIKSSIIGRHFSPQQVFELTTMLKMAEKNGSN